MSSDASPSLSTRFQFAPEDDWRFEAPLDATRRKALWSTPFDEIVDRMAAGLEIQAICRTETHDTQPQYKRLSLRLTAHAPAVDLFHNGRGGYRAQYFGSTAAGDAANAYAFPRLLARALSLAGTGLGSSRAHVLAGAIEHGGKLWIKEGWWTRPARRQLVVPRWREKHPLPDIDAKKATTLMRYGAAAPELETRLVLKGEWVDALGAPPLKPLKSGRGDRIRLYGFT